MLKFLFVGFATIDIIGKKRYLGGAAGAMSLNASFLGYKSYLFAPLSYNSLGKFYINHLNMSGVNIKMCDFSSKSIPTCTIDNPYEKGSERIWKDNGVLQKISKMSAKKNNINAFNAVFFCNSHPVLIKEVSKYMSARNAYYIPGPQVILKKNYLSGEGIKKTNIIFCNEEEAPHIFKTKPFKNGVNIIVETRGEKGGCIYTKYGGHIYFKVPIKTNVIDPTGAGDCFALGFGIKYLQTVNIKKAVSFAKELTGVVIQRKGGLLYNI